MKRNFEDEYRSFVTASTPDFWGKIESRIACPGFGFDAAGAGEGAAAGVDGKGQVILMSEFNKNENINGGDARDDVNKNDTVENGSVENSLVENGMAGDSVVENSTDARVEDNAGENGIENNETTGDNIGDVEGTDAKSEDLPEINDLVNRLAGRVDPEEEPGVNGEEEAVSICDFDAHGRKKRQKKQRVKKQRSFLSRMLAACLTLCVGLAIVVGSYYRMFGGYERTSKISLDDMSEGSAESSMVSDSWWGDSSGESYSSSSSSSSSSSKFAVGGAEEGVASADDDGGAWDGSVADSWTGSSNGYSPSSAWENVDTYAAQPVEPYEVETYGQPDTEEYDYRKENGFVSVSSNPFATFAADVDTASYANLRRQVLSNNSSSMRDGSVRIEELLNYFHYDYPEPKNGEPFGVYTEITDCPWNEQTKLLHIGLQAENIDKENLPRSNLVFLIDVSGSMDQENKLPLVKRSFLRLVETLNDNDTVSIVTYASGTHVLLSGIRGSEKSYIMGTIDELDAGGSTQADTAITTAYDLASRYYIAGGNNRVILATDGDFNVGVTSQSELTNMVRDYAKQGVFLSVLGFGYGNYKDNKLESMADNGNGNYAYIDNIYEARKVLINEAGGTLFTIAKDVKLQVEFNPSKIKGYRLIGYENRVMAAEDFANDKKDGGEIGAGHQVTALIEIVPVDSEFNMYEPVSKYSQKAANGDFEGASGEYCTVNIRYKRPEGDKSKLLEYPVGEESVRETPSDNMRWAAGVAEVGMLVTNSEYAGSASFKSAKDILRKASSDDFRDEFLYIVGRLQMMDEENSSRSNGNRHDDDDRGYESGNNGRYDPWGSEPGEEPEVEFEEEPEEESHEEPYYDYEDGNRSAWD